MASTALPSALKAPGWASAARSPPPSASISAPSPPLPANSPAAPPPPLAPMARRAFGFMPGPSCDGLAGAAIRVEGAGLGIRGEVAATVSLDFGPLAAPVRDFARGAPATAATIAHLALNLAELH